MIHLGFYLLQCKMKPKCAYCDFKKGLINAIKYQFKDTKIISCSFH